MRLMLGTRNIPSLLVEIQQEKSPTEFDFWVINGAWEGTFTNGHVTVWNPPTGSWSDLDITEILSDNQDRLRGDYNDVFWHFADVNYVAPKPKKVESFWDDDIPF